MKNKCKGCPFYKSNFGLKITTAFCMSPRCLRLFDRKIRKIKTPSWEKGDEFIEKTKK